MKTLVAHLSNTLQRIKTHASGIGFTEIGHLKDLSKLPLQPHSPKDTAIATELMDAHGTHHLFHALLEDIHGISKCLGTIHCLTGETRHDPPQHVRVEGVCPKTQDEHDVV